MLQVDDVISAYENAELTPILVVLGGSRSFNHHDSERDYDYFGYHLEETGNSAVSVITTIEDELFGVQHIQSYPVSRIIPMIFNIDDSTQSQHTLTNWLWNSSIFESKSAISIRDDKIIPLLTTECEMIIKLLEDSSKIHSDSASETTIKIHNRARRIHLTAVHLERTGKFNCDINFLDNKYS